MTLIKSISGIRGTIGGSIGDNLTPVDIIKFSTGYGLWLKKRNKGSKLAVVVGRDARISGEMVSNLVIGTLQGLGIDVINLGLSTTPTVEIAVPIENAQGGIIITASHNPIQWNALKLLNEKGEFISASEGNELLNLAEATDINFEEVLNLGKVSEKNDYIDKHIEAILKMPMVNLDAIAGLNLKVVVDAVNSTGGIAIPKLLKALGVKEVIEIYCDPTGHFPHNPEPLPENLTALCSAVKENKADLGIVVDPDVDRLAFVNEDGSLFGEEYTLVAIADYYLKVKPGATVSNLSSTRALRDVTESVHNQKYYASAVGEVNVVEKMKAVNAVIGGEGNGGIIVPELHYGRDALAGVALFLSHLATYKEGGKSSELRNSYTNYFMSKNKIALTPEIDVDGIFVSMRQLYKEENHSTIDGLKIDFENEWVHLRKSNTEPIIRIYAESTSETGASELTKKVIEQIKEFTKN